MSVWWCPSTLNPKTSTIQVSAEGLGGWAQVGCGTATPVQCACRLLCTCRPVAVFLPLWPCQDSCQGGFHVSNFVTSHAMRHLCVHPAPAGLWLFSHTPVDPANTAVMRQA
jgi:hypothetical protein